MNEYQNLEICDLTGKNQHQILAGQIINPSILTVNTDKTLAFLSAKFPRPDEKYRGGINTLQAWDILEKKLLWSHPANINPKDSLEYTYRFGFITIFPDGNYIITKSGKSKNILTVWEARTGKIIKEIKYRGGEVNTSAFIDKNTLLLIN